MSIESIETTSATASHAGAEFFWEKMNRYGLPATEMRILIAGCGAGHEAAWIQNRFSALVDAVDVDDFVPAELKGQADLNFQIASVCELPFADDSFDAIFYHHVIEHVDRPDDSLVELARVLKPNGWIFIGTPNRQRLVSSVGAHQQSEWESTFANKVKDNLRDWSDRFRGKFRNELGAHAGYSRKELDAMLAKHFARREWVTEDYLRFKYKDHRLKPLVEISTHSDLSWFVAPSIYAFCQKV